MGCPFPRRLLPKPMCPLKILGMPGLLAIENLAHTYPDGTKALRGVSLTLEPGEIVSVIGLSGAGKSTMLRCINGLIHPTSGRVEFEGRAVKWDTSSLRRLRRKIAMIFQQFNLIGNLSVMSNVLMGRLGYQECWMQPLYRFAKRDREIAITALDKVGLLNEWHKKARELSGGQQQRVGVARALAQEPRLLLADEPVSSLDPLTADSVLGHFVKIVRQEGLAALMNLHAVELARKYSDRILGVREGLGVWNGKPAELTTTVLRNVYGEDYAG
jgi:phosphonate transport system ATP-binding protein